MTLISQGVFKLELALPMGWKVFVFEKEKLEKL
jgi:hypothetical protein